MASYATLLCIICNMALLCTVWGAPVKIQEDNSTYDMIEKLNRNVSNLFEGDIVPNRNVDEATSNSGNAKREARLNRNYLWTTRIVPYTLSSEFSSSFQRDAVQNAMKVIEEKSCLKFTQHSNEKNWISFRRLDGCYSSVGRTYWQEGAQNISLGQGCLGERTVLHEIMHALGFWHEQSRPDRDNYIEIFWENINSDQVHNFKKYSHKLADVLGTQYDYGTIMHYGKYAFSKNGKQTLKSIGSDKGLGTMTTLNSNDITALNALYDCTSKDKSIWSTWTSYGPCDSTCYKKRQRFCSHVDLNKCPTANQYGVAEEKMKCTSAECYAPVDGHWGRWSSWSSCDKECGTGKMNRTRVCDNPEPKNGGAACPGDSISYSDCYIKKCGLGPLDCEFDGQGWCHWHNDPSNPSRFTWQRISGKTPSGNTGPSGDHTSGTGHYVYAEGSAPARTNDIARLISAEMPASEKRCMSFWYHMYGSSMGSLRVFKTENGVETLLWEKSGDQGNQWLEGKTNFTSKSPFKIIIEVQKGNSYLSDTGIDDITFDCPKKSILEQKCGIKMKALGCFNDAMGNRLFPELLDNHRDPINGHHGFTIDWYNYGQSIEEILCHCAKRTKAKGYKKFGLSYYAECWAGPDPIVHDRLGASDRCVNDQYDSCPFKDDAICCGSDNNHFVYQLL